MSSSFTFICPPRVADPSHALTSLHVDKHVNPSIISDHAWEFILLASTRDRPQILSINTMFFISCIFCFSGCSLADMHSIIISLISLV